jgi:threonine dehydratase
MALSLLKGERVQLASVDAFADGVAVKYVGAETYRLCRDLIDGVVLVNNSEISAAIKVREKIGKKRRDFLSRSLRRHAEPVSFKP